MYNRQKGIRNVMKNKKNNALGHLERAITELKEPGREVLVINELNDIEPL